ncbi:hypothetical protein B0H14DRAFT_3485139 [Mycena olivaceomarginata]|nr:hypothetical protein B0H14DRAFT_3485139 [Mycena olivaceomarginata]
MREGAGHPRLDVDIKSHFFCIPPVCGRHRLDGREYYPLHRPYTARAHLSLRERRSRTPRCYASRLAGTDTALSLAVLSLPGVVLCFSFAGCVNSGTCAAGAGVGADVDTRAHSAPAPPGVSMHSDR